MSSASVVPTLMVTGCKGQVGFELCRSLAPLGRVIALDRTSCDLSCPDEIRDATRAIRPDVIVNAAAYTAVDQAETDRIAATAVNGTAAGVFAEESSALGCLLVHYSSDYVFDGTKAEPYDEIDVPNPQSVYGQTKLAGEEAIVRVGAPHLILRTSWVMSAHGANFAKMILRLARERTDLRVVADQIGAPTSASLVADVTAQIVSRHWIFGDRHAFPAGIYHLAAAGETSRHSYAVELLACAAAHGLELRLAPERIEKLSSADYPCVAPRPLNSRLNTAKLRRTFGVHLPDWTQCVHYVLDQLLL